MKYLECALGKGNQIWKYLLVLLITFLAASFIGSIPLLIVYMIKAAQSGNLDLALDLTNLQAVGISSNLVLVLLMLPMVLGLVVLICMARWIHNRSYKELINGTNKIRWKRFFVGAAFWVVLMLIIYIVEYIIDPSNFVLQFDLISFIPLIFISLLLIPLQTSFEELAFRGYLAQGVGAWTKSRWLVWIIPSVLFGLMHYDNPEVKEFGFWLMMPQYIFFGMIFGLISILDDGIELAMGVHAANNVFLSLFITHSSSAFKTDAVFSIQKVNPYLELFLLVLSGVILVAFFYKKYNWSFSVMNKKIEKEADVFDVE